MAGINDVYGGKYLRVNLTTKEIKNEKISPDVLRKYMGGNGIGTRIIYDEVPPEVKSLDPENRLVFSAGPLNGTIVPGSGTYTVSTKGPLTEMLTCAQSNGFVGARMRFAGIDGIIFQGASDEWVYLWVHDGVAELRSAKDLMGLDTWETEDKLKEELGGSSKVAVACIGPAGENLVKYAGIFNDHGHLCASNGPGAVMGSKKLKAVAFSGTPGIAGANPELLKSLREPWVESANNGPMQAYATMGTLGGFTYKMQSGMVPVKNYQTNIFPESDNVDGTYIKEHYENKKRPCWSCPWSHVHEITITEGKHKGLVVEEPEYEEQACFSSMTGITKADEMLKLCSVTDRLGMDAKELSFTLGMVMDCYNDGLIDKSVTDGLDLSWGNAEAIEELLQNIAHRKGFGDVLAEGGMRAAEKIGGDAPNRVVYIKKGQGPHTHDDRGHWGLGFVQVISDMSSGVANPPDMFPLPDFGYYEPIPPYELDNLAKTVALNAGLHQVHDCIGCCLFLACDLDILVKAIAASTGWEDFTREEALEIGERIVTLQRCYSIRNGATPENNDSISPLMASVVKDGAMKGLSVAKALPEFRKLYYKYSGWDEETSKPLKETLVRLGLESEIDKIWLD